MGEKNFQFLFFLDQMGMGRLPCSRAKSILLNTCNPFVAFTTRAGLSLDFNLLTADRSEISHFLERILLKF